MTHEKQEDAINNIDNINFYKYYKEYKKYKEYIEYIRNEMIKLCGIPKDYLENV